MKWRTILAMALVSFLQVESESRSQDLSPLVGKRVVTKTQSPLRVGEEVVDDDSLFQVYLVERVNGDWLWVRASEVSGWLLKTQIVPIDQAADFYTQKIKENPGSPNDYLRRARIREETGEKELAAADYAEATRIDPGLTEFHRKRGKDLRIKKKYDKAVLEFSEAIRLNPQSPDAFFDRGHSYHLLNNYAKAIDDYTECLRLNPANHIAFNNRGKNLFKTNQIDKAVDDYNESLRLKPDYDVAYRNRGEAWTEKKEYNKAKADYLKANELKDVEETHYKLASVYLKMEDFDRTISEYELIILKGTTNYKAYDEMAWLLCTCSDSSIRDGKKALEAATTAVEMTSHTDPYPLDSLAAAWAELGNFDRACDFQIQAIKLSKDSKFTGEMLSRLRRYRSGLAHRPGPSTP